MEVILLERVAKLGQMGEKVKVRDGYARNFLLPAARLCAPPRPTRSISKRSAPSSRPATSSAARKRKSSARSWTARASSSSASPAKPACSTVRSRPAISPRRSPQGGISVDRNQIAINPPIKTLGLHTVPVALHPEVEVKVTINIARSPEEAERQARGEAVTTREEMNLDDLGLEVGAALAEAGDDDEL